MEDNYDYRVTYFNHHRGGYRGTNTQYCIWESDIVCALRPPKEQRIRANERYVRVQVFEELEGMEAQS